MSSILKALKKLENETDQQTFLVDSVDPKKTIRRSTMGAWLFYSVISALITIGILIGGGWLLLRQRPMITGWLHSRSSEEKKEIPKPEPVKENKPAPDIVKNEPVTAKAPEIPKPSIPEHLKESVEKKSEPPKLPAVPILIPNAEQEVIPPPRPVQAPKIQDNPRPVAGPPPADIDKLTEAEIEAEIHRELEKTGILETVPESDIPPPPPAASSPSQASEKQVEGLAIQALVWSEDPKSRMVMMNNQILHTGDTIDRYHIKEIGNDFVLLQEGTQELKMRFLVK